MIIINNNNKCLEWTLSRLCFFNQDCWRSQCFHIVALKEVLAVKSLWKWPIMAAHTSVLFPLEFPMSHCHQDKLADWKLTLQKCVQVSQVSLMFDRITLILPTICLSAGICVPLLAGVGRSGHTLCRSGHVCIIECLFFFLIWTLCQIHKS